MTDGRQPEHSWTYELARPPRLGRRLLWAGAAVAVFAAHAGAVALVLHQPPAPLDSDGPPPAFLIDMAPLPETSTVDETQLGEQAQNAPEIEEQPEPEPEEITPSEPEPEPEPEEFAEPEPEEPQEDLPEIAQAAVPIAAARPLPRPERRIRREVQREQPHRERPHREKPQQQQTRAAAQAPQSTRNAAPQAGAGSTNTTASPSEIARWRSRLMTHLERRKRYPSAARARREEGTVHVNFTLDDRGNVLAVSLVRSSGYPELDQAVLQLVQRASPVPPPPAGISRNITAPIAFTMR